MTSRLFALALATLLLASSGAAALAHRQARAAHLTSVSLVLDWYPNSDHGGLFTALQRGYLSRQGIKLSAYVPSDTTAQIKLVAAGKADFGISYETDLLGARAHGVPARSVMCIMQHPLNTVMALKSSGITRPRQLVGKRVGISGSPSDIPMLSVMMQHDGASIKQTHVVNVGYNLLPALLAHKVDAVIDVYWTWEAIQAEMKGHPVNVMRVERWGVPNYCELVLIASESSIRSRPALVRRVVVALQEGYAYAAAHPSYAWQALHARDKTLDRTLVLRSLSLLAPVVTAAPTIGYQSPGQWRAYAAWLWSHHLIDARVDAGQAFTNQFLQPRIKM